MKKYQKVLILIAILLIAGTLYYSHKNSTSQSLVYENEEVDQASTDFYYSHIDSLTPMGGQLGEYGHMDADSTDENPTKTRLGPVDDWVSSTSQTYTNSPLGFQLTFPDSWQGYRSREIKYKISFNNWVAFNETMIYFDMPNAKKEPSNRFFAIRAVAKGEWDSLPEDLRECNGGSKTPCIRSSFAKSDDYVFSYYYVDFSTATEESLDEVESIIKSFKIVK